MTFNIKKHKILTIVLDYNDYEKNTEKCLQSLRTQINVMHDILIVDNHSHDDPGEKIAQKFPDIKCIRNDKNLGVAGGRNVGIRYALNHHYDYVFLFDNDALAEPDMLAHLLTATESNPGCGIFGPKIYREDAPEIIWRAGCTSWKWTYLHALHIISKRIFRWAGRPLPKILDTDRGANQVDRGQFDNEEDVDFQIGCAQLIRTEVFHDIGLLDEDFSPYGSEDIDFCARARRSGWRIRYVPQATCRHRAGGSFQDEYERTYYNARHLMLLARKNLSLAYFWLLYLPDFIFLTLPLMMAESILQKKSRRRRALVDAVLWNLYDMKKRGLFIGRRAFSPEHRTDD
jgi:GT2 family glycosyltransferase